MMGRLLYELKAVDERTMQKYRQESQKAGKGSFALAWIMDQSEEERKRYDPRLQTLTFTSEVSRLTLRVKISRRQKGLFTFSMLRVIAISFRT